MRKRKTTGMLALAMAAAFAGCERSDISGPDTTYFRASISGAVSGEFEGAGRFILGRDSRRPAAPEMFSLFSQGRGGSADQTFQLFRPGSNPPEVGVHPLRIDGHGMKAQFSIVGSRGETLRLFSAYEGEVEITLATPSRIEGVFRVTAVETCRQTAPGSVFCSVPGAAPFPAGTPIVEVSGSFAADAASTLAGRRSFP